ncbi:MAG TPA: M14 family metallopeptidase [Gemmatimonadales bacterium]
MRAALAGAIIIAGLAPAAGAGAQQGPLTVGGITAAPGQAASGYLVVPAAPGDTGTRLPVTVIRGNLPGPTLALVAGTHGSEVAPIVALQQVRALVDPKALRGTLLLVHVANPPSYLSRTIYYSPVDGKNLNRVYPGDPKGTLSERIAWIITGEIIERADFLVDMHSGDGNESLRPYTYWNRLGLDRRVDSLAREMALAWGADHIIIDTTRTRDRAHSIYTQNTAHIRGKPALTTETGWLGSPEPAMVERNVDGAFRLLRFLGMLPGPVQKVEAPVWLLPYEVLTSPASGVWHPAVGRGESVARGTVIGVLTDFFGAAIAEIRSPLDGIVMYVVATPAMNRGEPVGMVAARAAGPPPD